MLPLMVPMMGGLGGRVPLRSTITPYELAVASGSWRTQLLGDRLAARQANGAVLDARAAGDRELVSVACRDIPPRVRQAIRQAVVVTVVGMTCRLPTSSRIRRRGDRHDQRAFCGDAAVLLPLKALGAMGGAGVACHGHGTALNGFLPGSWDHLDCQLWDHPARLAGGSWLRPFDHRVRSVDVEVIRGGIQGGRRG